MLMLMMTHVSLLDVQTHHPINFDPTATIDDGSCITQISGCVDIATLNYDSTANTDNGSCLYFGCIEQYYDPMPIYNNTNPNKEFFIKAGETTYDLQTNASSMNRINVHNDSNISFVWTYSDEFSSAYSNGEQHILIIMEARYHLGSAIILELKTTEVDGQHC